MGQAPLVLGRHCTAILRSWKDDRILRFFPEPDGSVGCDDSHPRPGEPHYTSLSVKEYLEQVRAISDMVRNSSHPTKGEGMPADYVEHARRYVERAILVAERAQELSLPAPPVQVVGVGSYHGALNF